MRTPFKNAYIYTRRFKLLEDEPVTGELKAVAFAGAPNGWLLCDGAAVSRATYAALFAVIGVAWGAGDGVNTFNVPDLRGRTIVGTGQGAALTLRNLAATGGEEAHQLTTPEIAAHSHTGSFTTTSPFLQSGSTANAPTASAASTGSTGGGGTHNNMQPFAAANIIIKT